MWWTSLRAINSSWEIQVWKFWVQKQSKKLCAVIGECENDLDINSVVITTYMQLTTKN